MCVGNPQKLPCLEAGHGNADGISSAQGHGARRTYAPSAAALEGQGVASNRVLVLEATGSLVKCTRAEHTLGRLKNVKWLQAHGKVVETRNSRHGSETISFMCLLPRGLRQLLDLGGRLHDNWSPARFGAGVPGACPAAAFGELEVETAQKTVGATVHGDHLPHDLNMI